MSSALSFAGFSAEAGRLLRPNALWPACSSPWFSCDSHFSNWPGFYIWSTLLLIIFVCCNYSFIRIAVTGSYSSWDEIFTTLKYWGSAEKHRPDMGAGVWEVEMGDLVQRSAGMGWWEMGTCGHGRPHSGRQLSRGQLKKCRLRTGQNWR